MIKKITILLFLIIILQTNLKSQDNRNQLPSLLSNAYFDVNIGYIDYPFTNSHLESGFTAKTIKVPHPAVRLTLFGYRFNKYLSAQISYMRPVNWIEFNNITGDTISINHSTAMNVGGLTLKVQYPLSTKFSLFAEGGLAIVTRHGFGMPKVELKDANYASILLGGGIKYHCNKKWDLVLSTTYSPANSAEKQPYTIFHAVGFTYNMHAISQDKINENIKAAYIFPHHLIQLAYSTNAFSYGVNRLFSDEGIPIFWGGKIFIEQGISLSYQQNIFHTKKVFSLDWGSNASFWRTNINKENFYTLSVFPVLRFTFLRTDNADFYFNYSVAGPTFISRINLDEHISGKNFTFQDFMGLGFYAGKNRKFNSEIKIIHYSNGNIFTLNPGITIPLTFNIGYTL
ncbi:MAG: acyloxyacyl hydrolase [Bacteroidetes bacterium]|nr:acyloxyacyl hydrolase [Bacteroidota bacterium]